jgi:hypothetical protein
MPAYTNLPYRNATKLANSLMLRILTTGDDKAAALLMREWRETEQVKREWRGLPRLSPASMKEIIDFKRAAMKTVTATTFEEIHDVPTREGKESISIPTVPTPPTGDDPIAPLSP